jgi:hypothetical protein
LIRIADGVALARDFIEQRALNLSRWRDGSAKKERALPPNYMAILRSDESLARTWDECASNWKCPICQRARDETIYFNDDKEVRFMAATPGRSWHGRQKICGQCWKIVAAIKAEARGELNHVPIIYNHLSHQDVASIIVPKAHCDHRIKVKEAEALVARVVRQIEDTELWESEADVSGRF